MKKSHSNTDLSLYRLNRVSELDAFAQSMGVAQFEAYKAKVFDTLSRMKEGDTFHFLKVVKRANVALFIKLCCLFILQHDRYELSDDYTILRRRRTIIPSAPPKWLKGTKSE